MQLKATIFVSIFMFCLILLFDFAEMTRKYPISSISETLFAIKLSLLRTPSTFCEIFHYVYFITATFSLWNLCQSNQITVLKATGKSPQQILYPFFGFAVLMAAVWLFIAHPMGLRAEIAYNKNISTDFSETVNSDVWIDCSTNNDRVIFIKNIYKDKIEGLGIFNVNDSQRIFAQQALVEEASWILKNATLINGNEMKNINTMETFNMVSSDLIKLLSKSPQKQNIYYLYKVYRIQKKDSVILKSYELELHKLLSTCYSFILFALAAAIICFPVNRYKTKTNITIKVIAISIFLKFINNMLESLAYGEVIPVRFACWSILLILTCISIAVLVWKEA
jgi:lipopolysaccharide export LptBFGC system permease protein LptF